MLVVMVVTWSFVHSSHSRRLRSQDCHNQHGSLLSLLMLLLLLLLWISVIQLTTTMISLDRQWLPCDHTSRDYSHTNDSWQICHSGRSRLLADGVYDRLSGMRGLFSLGNTLYLIDSLRQSVGLMMMPMKEANSTMDQPDSTMENRCNLIRQNNEQLISLV